MRSAAAIVARGQGAGTIAPDLGVAGGPAGPELLGHTFDRPALDDPLVFEQLPTKTVTRAQRPAATASDRRGYPTPHTLSSGVRWSTASSIITGRDTHPWTRKAGQGVDSPGSEVRSAPAERAVGLSGALSRSASAIRVPGCIAGHEMGLSPRPGPRTPRDGPLATTRPRTPRDRRWPATIRRWRATNRRSGAVSHLRVHQDGMAGGDRSGESRNRRPDPGPGCFAKGL